MTLIMNFSALGQVERTMYLQTEGNVLRLLEQHVGRSRLTECMVVSEDKMDRVFPPHTREINRRAAIKRTRESLEHRVADFLHTYAGNLTEEQLDRLKHAFVQALHEYLLGNHDKARAIIREFMQKEQKMGSHMSVLPDDLFGKLLDQISDISSKVDEYEKDYMTVTAMGCYSGGIVYLCPSRIRRTADLLACRPPAQLLEVVWTHEEMHALMNSNLYPQVSEHIVQTMVAAILDKAGKANALDDMVKLSRRQPEEYGLFAQTPNAELLVNLGPGLKVNQSQRRARSKTLPRSHLGPGLRKSSYTNTKITEFVYDGQSHKVDTWKGLLVELASTLHAEDPSKFDQVVSLRGTKRSYFSTDPRQLDQGCPIPGTSFYVEGYLSANQVVRIARRMVSIYDGNPSGLAIRSH